MSTRSGAGFGASSLIEAVLGSSTDRSGYVDSRRLTVTGLAKSQRIQEVGGVSTSLLGNSSAGAGPGLHLDVQDGARLRTAHRYREPIDACLEVLLQRLEVHASRELVAAIAALADDDRHEYRAHLFVVDGGDVRLARVLLVAQRQRERQRAFFGVDVVVDDVDGELRPRGQSQCRQRSVGQLDACVGGYRRIEHGADIEHGVAPRQEHRRPEQTRERAREPGNVARRLIIAARERYLRAVDRFHGDGHDLQRAALSADAVAAESRNAQLDRRSGRNDRVTVHDNVLPDVAVDGISDAEFFGVRSDALVELAEDDGALRNDELLGGNKGRRRYADDGA